jgi:DNA-binding NtrC family response regulator
MSPLQTLRGKRILLVEGDYHVRDSISIYFTRKGSDLLAFGTAEEALPAMERGGFEIIISNYRLPGRNGIELLRSSNDFLPSAVKILLLTRADEDVIAEGKKIGIHDFIEKPFVSKTIEESLSQLIENHLAG